jgi:putative transposase
MNSTRTFFITTVTAQRFPIFRKHKTATLLIETLAHYRDQRKFLLHEFVIMPDHIHALLTPASQISLERAMQFIKGGFSYRLKSRSPVWQPSFTNHRVRDWQDYVHHREYIRMNPVRAHLAAFPEACPYSSAANVIRLDEAPQGLKPNCVQAPLVAALQGPLFHGCVEHVSARQDLEDMACDLRAHTSATEHQNR